MDAIVSLSEESVKSSHPMFLADIAQKACKLLDRHETSDQGQSKRLKCDKHTYVQDSNTNFDHKTLVQNTINILSKEIFLDSKYEYIIHWHENAHLSTFSVKKCAMSKDEIYHQREMEQESSIKLFNINSSSVHQLSNMDILTEHNPPPAHKRSELLVSCIDVALCSESARKQEKNQNNLILSHQNQDNSCTLTQLEPLDLTSKSRQYVDRAPINSVNVVSDTEGEQHFSSYNQGQREVSLATFHNNNLTEKLDNHPSNSSFISSYNNSVYQDQSTEYACLHFCMCGQQIKHNKSDTSCACLSCNCKHSALLESIPQTGTSEENIDRTNMTPTLNILESSTSQSRQNSQLNRDSNETLFFPVCEPKLLGCWGDTFIVHSDTESDASLLIYPGPNVKSKADLRTMNSLFCGASSNRESTLTQALSVEQQNLSSNGTLIESDQVLSSSNISPINVDVYDGSKHLPSEGNIQDVHELQLNESGKVLENVAISSCLDNERSIENDHKSTFKVTASSNCNVPIVPKQDSNDDSIYVSDEHYCDTDLDTPVCKTKKTQLYKIETNKSSLATWTITNITKSHSSTSLKIKLCKISKPVSVSNQKADNVETESRSVTDRLAVSSDKLPHACGDSKTVSSIDPIDAEDNQDIFSFIAYPETPEISHAGSIFSENYLHLTDANIQKSSTPFMSKMKTHKKIDTERQKCKQDLLPGKEHKCEGKHSVFNMGFLVNTGKARTAYFEEVNNKNMQPFSFGHSAMLRANATDKISSTMKFRGAFLQSLKGKLSCRKSNMSLLDQNLSSEKCSNHSSVSNEQLLDRFCEVKNDNCDYVVTNDDFKTVDLLNLQEITVRKSSFETTELASLKLRRPQLLKLKCKNKSRKVSQRDGNQSKTLLRTLSKVLKQSDHDKKISVLEDLSSIRKSAETKMGFVPLNLNHGCTPVVSCISKVKSRNQQNSDSMKGINKDEFSNTSNKFCEESASLMRHSHSGDSFQQRKTNPALLAMTRRLTLREIFKVKRLTEDVAQQLITFMRNKKAKKLSLRLADEVSKVIIFYLCALCGIKVTVSDSDNFTAKLQKLKNSRAPTENDVHQVIRRIRRQEVHEQQEYHF